MAAAGRANLESRVWIAIGLSFLVVTLWLWTIERRRRKRRAALRAHAAAQPTAPPQRAPPTTEELIGLALRKRDEELARASRTVEVEPEAAPPAAPPNPRMVKLEEPPIEVQVEAGPPAPSEVQRMAQEQWDQVHVVGPAADAPRPRAGSRPSQQEDFEAPAPRKAKPVVPEPDWDDVEIRQDKAKR